MSTDPASGAPAQAQGAPASDPMAALVDIRNQVIRLGQEVAALRAAPPQGSDAINGVTAELREAVRFLAERLDGVARMVAQRGEELADTRGALGAIDAHVRSQAETIGVLTTGMQALPAYGQQVSGLQDNLTALQQRLGSMEGSIGQRLGGIEQAVARPPDAEVSERLSALEGMLGPLAQRLAQANSDQAASLQALHGKLDSVASGTQAALAQPLALDASAVAALEPKLAELASQLQALRSDVAAAAAARDSSDAAGSSSPVDLAPVQKQLTGLSAQIADLAAASARASAESRGGGAPVDLSPLQKQLGDLAEQIAQVAQVAAAPRGGGESGAAFSGDVDAAIASAETRIKEHVDDAVMALAQTLLGRGVAVALVDEPAPTQPAPATPALAATTADEGDDDEHVDDDKHVDNDDDDADFAPIDFSKADLDDDDADTTKWERPARDDDRDEPEWAPQRGYDNAPAYADAPESSPPLPGGEAPSDPEAVRGTSQPMAPPDPMSTVVPERRRRWFSW